MVLLTSNGAMTLALRHWRRDQNHACNAIDLARIAAPFNSDQVHESDLDFSNSSPFSACAALILFAATFPALIVIYFMLLAGGQTPIFSQIRVGRGERPFNIYKFRTIAEANTRQILSKSDRLRARWFRFFGNFLRRTGLDELPQLINILFGDMSFFGPRPLSIPDYQRMPVERSLRSFVRPGLTGLAQILGGQALKAPEKLSLDLWYLQNRTFCVDLNIFCLSALRAVGLYNSQCVAQHREAQLLLMAAEFRELAVRRLVRR